MRTIVDIELASIVRLDAVAAEERTSRAALIRAAVAEFLERRRQPEPALDGFGLWADRAIDGLAYQEELRREW